MIICLMGPTGCGKTDLAVQLHDAMGCEIISVDSAMIYRGMDIGTAKPSPSVLMHIPHYLVDICDPAQAYSAAQFCVDAKEAVRWILAQHRTPLLVGGTMLYFYAFQQGLSSLPQADEGVRDKWRARLEREGIDSVHQRLAQIDPVAALRIKPHDTHRVLRALEVYELTGCPLSTHYLKRPPAVADQFDEPIVNIILVPSNRQLLHKRLEARLSRLFDAGLVDEVKRLYARGDLNSAMPSMRAVGYRQIVQYLEGHLSESDLFNKILFATRQLAKRQMTWLRKWPTQRYQFVVPSGHLAEAVMAVLKSMG